ncbi:MAG: hypothetical protein WKG03_02905 [Telluria sp.]
MNDHQIYCAIAKTPDIRAVQICDALDVELIDVSDALKSLVSVGDVVRHTGVGPNGLPAQLYNLSADFRKSREGAALIASLPAAAPPVLAHVTPAPPTAAAPPVSTPVFQQEVALPRAATKVAQAIEHVKIHGAVSDVDMRTVMGLPRTSAPKAYLISAIKDGRIRKNDAGLWEQGDGTPPMARAPKSVTNSAPKGGPATQFPKTAQSEEVANVIVVGNTILVSKDHKEIAPEVLAAVAAVTEDKVKSAPPPEGSDFRCGLWSDGVIELQRDGHSLVELTRAEGEHLATFVGRILGAADQISIAWDLAASDKIDYCQLCRMRAHGYE